MNSCKKTFKKMLKLATINNSVCDNEICFVSSFKIVGELNCLKIKSTMSERPTNSSNVNKIQRHIITKVFDI